MMGRQSSPPGADMVAALSKAGFSGKLTSRLRHVKEIATSVASEALANFVRQAFYPVFLIGNLVGFREL